MRISCQTALPAIDLARRAGAALLSLVYPPHCAACQAETDAGSHLCAQCSAQARRIEAPFCRQCSQPFQGAIVEEFRCGNCDGRRFHFECAVAPYRAQGVVRDLVHRFKYEKQFYLRHQLGEWMMAGLEDPRLRSHPIDAIVPVPLHPARLREREFNQAGVLAEIVAGHARKPVVNGLRRTRYTTTQTRLDRDKRMENLRGAFCVEHPATVIGRHLLLIDDIFTTGSTAEECARVLGKAGAASVRVLAVARA